MDLYILKKEKQTYFSKVNFLYTIHSGTFHDTMVFGWVAHVAIISEVLYVPNTQVNSGSHVDEWGNFNFTDQV